MNRNVKIVVIGSVLLNVLLIGFVVGHLSHRVPPPFRDRPPREEILRALPPQGAKLFKEKMRGLRKENRKTHRKIRDRRDELMKILTAPTFDSDLYKKKADELHALHSSVMKDFARSAGEIAAKMSPEERQILARHFKRGPDGRSRRGGGGPSGGRGRRRR